MKKQKLFLLLLSFITITLQSCKKENVTNISETLTANDFKKASFEEQKIIIKNDKIAKKLVSLELEFRKAVVNKNFNKVKIIHDKIKLLLKEFYNKYGTKNIYMFTNNLQNTLFQQQIYQKIKDGDKCHRNSDGTVNYDACDGFWENLIVAIRVGFCPDDNIEDLYNCAQEKVCITC